MGYNPTTAVRLARPVQIEAQIPALSLCLILRLAQLKKKKFKEERSLFLSDEKVQARPTEETPRAGLDSPAFSRVQGVTCQCLGPELGQEILFSGTRHVFLGGGNGYSFLISK